MLQLLWFWPAVAQTTYNFSHKTEAYMELTSSTAFSGVIPAIPIPFPFSLAGMTNDTIFLLNQAFKMDYSIGTPAFTPFGADLVNGARSYEVAGLPGQQILKLQFKNMNFGHDFNLSDTINYQVWFFESDNAMEVRFGRSNIQNPVWSYYYNEGGPYIGLSGYAGTDQYRLTLNGNPASPLADTSYGRLQGTPADGQVYRFAPLPNKVREIDEGIGVYPNPSDGRFYLRIRNKTRVEVRIWNGIGQMVYHKSGYRAGEQIQAGLPPGVYILEVEARRKRLLIR